MQRLPKYSRAFDWRISKARKGPLTAITEALVDLFHKEQLEIFEDFLYLGRKRRNNKLAMAKLQLHLIEELIVAQKAIKHYKEKQEKMNLDLPHLVGEQKDQLEAELRFIDRNLFFHRHFANCIRLIGDGIAWRALGYDRAALRLLSQHSTKQEILSDGVFGELAEWAYAFDNRGGLAVFNSITNCLAFGDVTIVKDDGSVEIVEVKSSNTKSRRLTRQKQGMREVVEILTSGEGALEKKERASIMILDLEPENGLAELLGFLQKASTTGFAAGSISNFLYVECVDFRSVHDSDKMRNCIDEARERHLKAWEERNDVFLPLDSADFMAFSPNCAPFSVFPFPDDVCVDLMTGARMYVSFLNVSEVAREFVRRGWQILRSPEDIRRDVQAKLEKGEEAILEEVFVVRKNGFHASVSPGEVARMQMEALRPKVIIKAREMIRELGPGAAADFVLTVFKGEQGIWH